MEMATDEPNIVINGRHLTEGQAMTIRVAVQNFAMTLQDGLGDDPNGVAICRGYQINIAEINAIMAGADSTKEDGDGN